MKQLLDWINSPNIAADLDKDILEKVGEKVVEDYQKDKSSMADWIEGIEDGLKTSKLTGDGKSFPWEDASNYKTPMIHRAVWQFGDRATIELLTNKNLVRASVANDVPENVARKNRIVKHMNWQFNYEMPDWREQQEHLFYETAAIGCVFKKTFFDPTEGANVSRVIHYPNFAVNNEDTSCDRFSECKDYTPNEIQELVNSGVFIEFEYSDEKREEEINEAADRDDDNSNGLFIEQSTNYDLDDDGYAEPYMITVHKASGQVCRIVALFDESSIFVKAGEGVVVKLPQALEQKQAELAQEKLQEIQMEMQQAVTEGAELEELDPQEFIDEMRDEALSSLKIIKIKRTNLITKYGFLPDPQGKYLNWGLLAVLAPYCKLINTTTNQLIDAGTLANVPGGLTSQEFRNHKKPLRIKPGEFANVAVPAQVLAQGLQYWQFKGPDPQLSGLNEGVKAEANELAASVNLQDAIAPNAPAATTLGILQEKLVPTTALLKRLQRSMSQEFRIMAELNFRYTDPQTYLQVVDEQADYRADYETASQDIQLTASASMTNQAQKMQTASVLSSEIPNIIQAGGDIRPIISFMFEGIGADDLYTQVFPDPNSMTPEQQAAMQQQQAMQQQMLQQQQLGNQLQQASLEEQQIKNQLKQAELQLKQQEVERKDMEAMSDIQNKAAQLQIDLANQQIESTVAQAEIEQILAQAEKYRAEAASTVVTAQADAMVKQLQFIQQNLERFNP